MRSDSSAGSLIRTRIVIALGLSDPRLELRLAEGLLVSHRSGGGRGHLQRHPEVVRDLVDIATRHGGGIEVALIWNRRDETLVVFAYDAMTKEEVAIPVTGDEAAEVYRHPFAYAHRSGGLDLSARKTARSASAVRQ
jgi:hypothetical protein